MAKGGTHRKGKYGRSEGLDVARPGPDAWRERRRTAPGCEAFDGLDDFLRTGGTFGMAGRAFGQRPAPAGPRLRLDLPQAPSGGALRLEGRRTPKPGEPSAGSALNGSSSLARGAAPPMSKRLVLFACLSPS